MSVIERWAIYVCPGCGRNLHSPRHVCKVPNPGLSERVEVVRADAYEGAVDRVASLEVAIREHLGAIQDAWDGTEQSPLWGLGDPLETALAGPDHG